MKQKVLLLEDVEALGRSGEIVAVKVGYGRNFLIPQKKAVVASKQTIRMQEKLRRERAIQAEKDRKEAEEMAGSLEGLSVTVKVKIDVQGHLYGSVSAQDIYEALLNQKVEGVEKKYIQLPKPIKTLGSFKISLRLKEGVMSSLQLVVEPEEGVRLPLVEESKEEKLKEFEQQSEEAKEE